MTTELAFPRPTDSTGPHRSGMTLRDYFAARAPVEYGMVCSTFGETSPNLNNEATRAAIMSVWAFLRYEYADAMMAERATEAQS